jgi:3-oxoacyl-[acyl-carrier protein] reductase
MQIERIPLMRAALVSGAGIGIGAATAKILGREGYHVFVSDILPVEGEAVADEIRQAGGSAEFAKLDVSDTAACEALVAQIDARFGGLSALVANAGIAPRAAYPILTDDKWDEVLNVNLKGQLRLIRAAAPAMSARQEGAVVCVSSIAGAVVGWDDHWHYSAAKAGITGMVKAAACELAKAGVRVNAVAPGIVKTDFAAKLYEGREREVAATYPLGRLGVSADVAESVSFLLSDASSWMTGQVIVLDGGVTLRGME